MLLVDTTDVSTDVRYLDTTKSSYQSDLTSGTTHYKWAQEFWSQKRSAEELRIGRWVKTATAALAVGPDAVTTAADYAALTTTGQLNIVEGASNEDINPDFTGDTTFADVAASIQTALQAGVLTAAYTCSIDNHGRIQIVSDNPGSTADSVSWGTPAAGTDLSGASYLGTSVSVDGLDAEEPSDALTAISAINDEYYDIAIRGESTAQQQTLAATVESLAKQLTLVSTEAGAKSAISTSDVPYLLSQLGYDRTHILYTEHNIDELVGMVDAAVQGTCLPAEAGTTAWSSEKLSGVYESGKDSFALPLALTNAERSALEDKNCNYIVNTGGVLYSRKGVNCSGEEKVTMIGVDWLQENIQNDIHSYNVNHPRPAFDEPTLAAYEKIVRQYLTEALSRGFIVDTRERPITISFPDADDFTAAQRASHTMTLSNVFSAYINSTVNDVVITGEFRI
jgi:hypothetical protein